MTARLLYVEDNPADVELLRLAFEEAGWKVDLIVADCVRDAQAFLSSCSIQGRCPDVAVIDLNLPGVSGWDLFAWIDDKPGMPTQKVVYSSSRRPVDLERARALGATAFLCKPADIDGFASVVSTLRRLVEAA